MKINEIIVEQGLLSRLGQGIKGAYTGLKSAQQTRNDPLLQKALERWKRWHQYLVVSGKDMNDKKVYSDELNHWLENQLRLGQPYPIPLTDVSAAGVSKHIQTALAKNLTQRSDIAAPPPPPPAAAAQPPTAAAGLPSNVKILATNPIVMQVGKQRFELDNQNQWHYLGTSKPLTSGQQAVLNQYLQMIQPTAAATTILNNIKIANANPLVYQYGKQQYHLNGRGNWAKFPGEKEVPQTVAALLNQAADRDGL